MHFHTWLSGRCGTAISTSAFMAMTAAFALFTCAVLSLCVCLQAGGGPEGQERRASRQRR